jgi:hypothetical protein
MSGDAQRIADFTGRRFSVALFAVFIVEARLALAHPFTLLWPGAFQFLGGSLCGVDEELVGLSWRKILYM